MPQHRVPRPCAIDRSGISPTTRSRRLRPRRRRRDRDHARQRPARVRGARSAHGRRASRSTLRAAQARARALAARRREPGRRARRRAFRRASSRPTASRARIVVELHMHGGAFRRVAHPGSRCSTAGVRQALPGEFSFRAVRNGKMTLSQAQAVADLIAASQRRRGRARARKTLGLAERARSPRSPTDLRKLAVLGRSRHRFRRSGLDEVSLPTLKQRLAPIVALARTARSELSTAASRLQDGRAASPSSACRTPANRASSTRFWARIARSFRRSREPRATWFASSITLRGPAAASPSGSKIPRAFARLRRTRSSRRDRAHPTRAPRGGSRALSRRSDASIVRSENGSSMAAPSSLPKDLGVLTKADLADPARLGRSPSKLPSDWDYRAGLRPPR